MRYTLKSCCFDEFLSCIVREERRGEKAVLSVEHRLHPLDGYEALFL